MIAAVTVLMLTIRERKLVEEMKAINYGVSEDEDQGKTETVNGHEKLPRPVFKSLLLILATIGLWFLGYNAVTTFFTSYATATWKGGLSHASTCLMVATVAAVASYIPKDRAQEHDTHRPYHGGSRLCGRHILCA